MRSVRAVVVVGVGSQYAFKSARHRDHSLLFPSNSSALFINVRGCRLVPKGLALISIMQFCLTARHTCGNRPDLGALCRPEPARGT